MSPSDPTIDDDPSTRIGALLQRADTLRSTSPAEAVAAAREASALAEQDGDAEMLASAELLLGGCLLTIGDYEAAAGRLNRSLAMLDELGRKRDIGACLLDLGAVFDALGDFDEALSCVTRGHQISVELGDLPGQARALNSLGIIYSKSGDPEQGLLVYRQAEALYAAATDTAALARTRNNIGINLKNLGRYEEALAVLHDAAVTLNDCGLLGNYGGALNNTANTLALVGRHEEAERTFLRARDCCERGRYLHGVTVVLLDLGKFYLEQRRLADAQSLLDAARAKAGASGGKHERLEAHRALSQVHELQGDFARALEHHKRFHDLERQVFNEKSDRKLQALRIKSQLVQAQREAEIHRLRHVELAQSFTELQRLHESLQQADRVKSSLLALLERQTFEDSLTGLNNRRYLDQQLALEFKRARRHDRPLTVAVCDIDNFKRINDRFGHAVGDATLRAVAQLLRRHARETDIVARSGGEEFVIALLDAGRDDAMTLCEAIRRAIVEYPWSGVHSELAVTLSIGVCADRSLADHEIMLRHADAALYRAKAEGKNRVCCAEAPADGAAFPASTPAGELALLKRGESTSS